MPLDRGALLQHLMASFQEEAAERLAVLDSELSDWPQGEPSADSMKSVFREVHSLKGAARAVGLEEPEQICHAWEAMLLVFRDGKRAFQPEMATLSLTTLQLLKHGLQGGKLTAEEVQQTCAALKRMELSGPAQLTVVPPPTPVVEQAPPTETDLAPLHEPPLPSAIERTATRRVATTRVRAEHFDELAYHGEALRQTRLQMHDLSGRSRDMLNNFQRLWQRRLRHEGLLSRLRTQLAKGTTPDLTSLHTLLEWQDWSLALLSDMQAESHILRQTSAVLDREIGSLSETYTRRMDSLLQLPCRSLLDELPPMVSELAAQTGKQAALQLPNTPLQVDKRILDALRTPLMHLLRNAIDHGIEMPGSRQAAGKPAVGSLSIHLNQHSASHFTLVLEDDGGGIDPALLQQKAEKMGLVAPGSPALPPSQLLPLIFESGLSTSRMITTLSGRGEGLAIVREALEQLGGDITVQSDLGKGCCFTLRLPLSRSIFRVVLVRAAEQMFAIPANVVGRILRLPASALMQDESGCTVQVEGLNLPVRSLAGVLALPMQAPTQSHRHLLLLGEGMQQIALEVDEVMGDQEITLKSLGKQLKRVRNLLGATMLGDGNVVPVLHPQDLYRNSLQATAIHITTPLPTAPTKHQARILVADDSFTSRGLLRALLETAGYAVQTANDGLEAWNALRQGQFDLLVSDIEMPRMDGFTLTARLRADAARANLPVVLVTALQSDEDRARGLEVGANAYLVKGGLETDTVLSAVKRLL
ncbi:hybrid sensor histidine kinase/response regulator [Chitinimonas sp. BJB300]|uniref:hybrid sensor histidine kinase/response regulator n=1 Tax=Chitinimonas sp. BJB300 TaxID=1559339 RepID=UPI000C0D24D0|nr:response regulator [Chitinimonas sp. BJB300]PHV12851.1 hybrid sensor histidine kinase/response regulator [Chitinimonas sp. BJB300]TSJ86117.1 response regulator [Chitinimonas sp. BJB300]